MRSGPVWSRPEFLFIGTAVMLLTGVLIPWPDRVMDILWICHLSLTASVFVICVSAQSTSQLEGFPPLAAAGSFLSFLATAGCIRAIVLRRDTCGRLIRAVGDAIAALEPLLALLVIVVIGFFLLYLVLQAGRRMRQAIEQYLFQILPFKKIGLETDQTLGILTAEQGRRLGHKIFKEAGFYASMNGLRKLLTAQISANLFLLLAAWGLAWLGEMLQAAAGQSTSPLEALAPILTGTAVFSWVPAGITAAACAALLSKESLALPRRDQMSEPNKRKIQIVSSISGRVEEIELLNPDSVSDTPAQAGPAEQIAQFEPKTPQAIPQPLVHRILLQCPNSDQYYRAMENLLTEKSDPSSMRLLLAESVHDLPVTVAVRPAIQLARKKQRILLIDADPRNALAQVFNLDPASLHKPAPVPRIPGLWLQTLSDSVSENQNTEAFTCRILYAPAQERLPEQMWNTLGENRSVFFFSLKNPDQIRVSAADWRTAGPLYIVTPLHAAVKPAS